MTFSTWILIALVFSLGINILLALFSRAKARQVMAFSENITELIELMDNYKSHVKVVSELEAFYGDETLEALLQHTTSLVSVLEDNFSEYEDYLAEYIIDEEHQDGEKKTERNSTEKDVFYAGTRERNN
ncbi:MAG: hypothetical protein ACXACY_06375 [Candidatus Hodarchaeales archaeon]|jgi:hypothetical protein